MPLDKETYHALIKEAGILPFCEQLYEIDKYAALRYFSTMEQNFCRGPSKSEYLIDDKYNELAFSKDLNSDVFSSMQEKLKVKPENNKAFWDASYQIFYQLIIYIKNNKHISVDQKIDVLTLYRQGIKTRRLLDTYFKQKTDELLEYINEAIHELMDTDDGPSIGEAGSMKDQKKRKKDKEQMTFNTIFKDPKMAKPLREFLLSEEIISAEGTWIGKVKGNTDIMGFADALIQEGLIYPITDTEIGRILKKEFNHSISERSFTISTYIRKDSYELYLSLVNDFILDYHNTPK